MVSGRAGGIESLLRDYVEYSRHENLFLFAWAGGPVAEQIEAGGSPVIVMDKQKQGTRAVCKRILELCDTERVDVIVAHHAAPMLRLAAMAAKLRSPRIKVICYAHSNAFELCDGRRKKGLALRKWIYRTTFLRADAAVAISNSVRDSLVEYLGLPGSRITVIYNGAILERFHRGRTEGGKTLRLIYVGRLIEEKGVKDDSDKARITEAYTYLGIYFYKIKNDSAAAKPFFEKLIQIDPENPTAKQVLATY